MDMYYQTCLIHHGVKGMKWGVRHDKKSNGVSRNNNRSTSKSSYNKKRRKGLSTTQKVLLGVAIVGAAAVVGTMAYRQGRLSADTIIKKGTLIQNVAPKGRSYETSFYGVYDKKSQQHFLKNFSAPYRDHVNILKSDKDLKIAGVKEMKKAYKNAYGKKTTLGWKNFYRGFGGLTENQRSDVIEQLAKKGYHGFKDYNDLMIGWGNTPTVFFGSGGVVKENGVWTSYDKYIDTGLKVVKTRKINVTKAQKLKPQAFTWHKEAAVMAAGEAAVTGGMYGLLADYENKQKKK